jgi:hypothetical protein
MSTSLGAEAPTKAFRARAKLRLRRLPVGDAKLSGLVASGRAVYWVQYGERGALDCEMNVHLRCFGKRHPQKIERGEDDMEDWR